MGPSTLSHDTCSSHLTHSTHMWGGVTSDHERGATDGPCDSITRHHPLATASHMTAALSVDKADVILLSVWPLALAPLACVDMHRQ